MKKEIIVGTMRLGVWGANLDIKGYQAFIEAAFDLGLTQFDHADIYGHYTTEAAFGAAFSQTAIPRESVQFITKCGINLVCPERAHFKIKSYNTSREHIIQSVENSLKNLQTDYIDTLLIHRPDYLLDPEEIAKTISQLKASGKVKAFGVSNFTTAQFDLLHSYTPLCTHQMEVSIHQRQAFDDGTLEQCMQNKIRPTAWSPLGGGALFQATEEEQIIRIKSVAKNICDKHQIELDQLLLAWIMRHPSGIIPVVGTSKVSRLASAKKALETNLSREEWYELWSAATGTEVP